MKNKIFRIIMILLLLLIAVSFVACNNNPQEYDDSQNQNKIHVSGTDVYSKKFTIEQDDMRITVANSVESFDFSNTFIVADDASYTIFDPTMLNSTALEEGNVVKLREGNNIFYLTVTNEDLQHDYYITIRRRPLYCVRFSDLSDDNIQYVEEGDYAEKPTVKPQKEHYTFRDWDLNFSTPIMKDTIVKASFVPVTYKIRYKLNGALSANNPDTYSVESEKNLLQEPIGGEGLFCGWYINDRDGRFIEAVGGSDNVYGDITLYALFEKDIKSVFVIKNGVVLKYEGGDDNGNVKIPDTYYGYKVNGIDSNAFKYSPNVKTIALSKSMEKVPSSIFGDCYNLQSVEIDSDNQYYKIQDNCLIDIKSQKLLKSFNGNSIPEGISVIGDYAFRNCLGISILNIPYGVTYIGANAFSGCVNINGVTIPESIKTIGANAFKDCYGIYEICNESALQIQVGDQSNGEVALYAKRIINDESESGIVFEDNFIYCIDSSNKALLSYQGESEELLLSASITEIHNYACKNLHNLKLINIPNNVENIGFGVFNGCENIETIKLPFVGACRHAFGYIFGLPQYEDGVATYYIPESLNNVVISCGDVYAGAFATCRNIKSIEINGNYSQGALSGCSGLEYLSLTIMLHPIGYVFGETIDGVEGTTQHCYNKYNSNNYEEKTYYIPKSLKRVKLKGDVICEYALENCKYIESVEISESITRIRDFAFSNCTGLTNIAICSGVTSIGSHAFYNCKSLTSLTIPDSVLSINYGAFWDCTSLTSVTIGSGVTNIASSAFLQCYKLVEVYNKSSLTITAGSENNGYVGYYAKAVYTKPYTSKLSTDENGYIIYTDGDNKILVGYNGTEIELTLPNGITEIYRYAFYNNTKITSITIPDSVKRIGNQAFYYCTELTRVTIPDSVRSIGNSTFYDCSNITDVYITDVAKWCAINFSDKYANPLYYAHNLYLNDEIVTDLVIPDGVVTIPYGIFRNCSKLTSVTIPNSVTSIGAYAFYYCTHITNVTLSNNISSIEDSTFYGCKNLTSITIPENVTRIGNQAFIYCRNLKKINILGCVESIGRGAFIECGDLMINIPKSITNIGEKAFYKCRSLQIFYEGTWKEWTNITFGASWREDVRDYSINYSSKYDMNDVS